MGIGVWRLRAREPQPESPRLRLEAGHGDVVVVADEDERSRYRPFLADLVAVIGAERCRYGRWADSPDAGVALDECAAHGIDHIVAFGSPHPRGLGLINADPLAELIRSGDARRTLWQRIAGLCGS